MTAQLSPSSILYCSVDRPYLIMVHGSRASVERAFARIPEYWRPARSEDIRTLSTRSTLAGAAGIVGGPLGFAWTLFGLEEGPVPATPPSIVPAGDGGKFDPPARPGQDWFAIYYGTTARDHGGGQFSVDRMRWDLNGQGATDLVLWVGSPDGGERSNVAPETSTTARTLAERQRSTEQWDDLSSRVTAAARQGAAEASEAASRGIQEAGQVVENSGSLLSSLTNPWVLIPVAVVVGIGFLAVTILPAVLSVRVNR